MKKKNNVKIQVKIKQNAKLDVTESYRPLLYAQRTYFGGACAPRGKLLQHLAVKRHFAVH